MHKLVQKNELRLISDNKTRWTSLYHMLERFKNLYDPVVNALKKLDSELLVQLDTIDRNKLNELVEVLQILEVASRAFSRVDCNLLTAERTIDFILRIIF